MIQYFLLFTNLVIIALGGAAAFICYRGYRKHSSLSMLWLTVGFMLIAVSSVAGMVLLDFTELGFWEIQSIESSLIAFGFLYIAQAIFTKRG